MNYSPRPIRVTIFCHQCGKDTLHQVVAGWATCVTCRLAVRYD